MISVILFTEFKYNTASLDSIVTRFPLSSNLMWIFYDMYYLEYITALGDLLLVLSNLTIVIYWIIKYIKLLF